MKHLLSLIRFCHAVLLVAIIGLSATSCRDSVSISETTVEVPLSSLTVTPGTLQPAFSSNTTSYQVEVSTTVSTVTVTTTPRDSTTTLSINGIDTNPGQGRPITLSSSEPTTTISIVLTSQNGLESRYDILVRKVDNTLSSLSVTPGPLAPTFNPGTLNYQVDVANDINSVTVVATKADSHAVMSGSVTAGAGVTTGQAIIPLNGPGLSTEISITVGVPNGEARTYRITVRRAASGNNNLSALTVTPPGSFPPPGFSPSTLTYTVNVATNVNRVDVTATKSDPNAVMAIDSTIVPAGTASGSALNIPLGGPGTPTTISIVVTAQNGIPKTYSVTVNRAASTDDTLSALTVTANSIEQPLAPGFNPSTFDYTVTVAATVTEVTVSATKSDRSAVMLIGSVTVPAGTLSGQETFPLSGPGSQTVTSILVTAQSGGAPKTYTIRVNRAASNDNNLSALSLIGNTATGTIPLALTPLFDRNHLNYTVEASFDVQSVTVTATKSDPNAILSGSVPDPGAGIAIGQATIQYIFLLPPQVSITVIAQDGTPIPAPYTITVIQMPTPPPFP